MIRYLFISALLSSASLVSADELSLMGDAKLSGTVRSINAEGVVELSTPLSPETIFLKGESVSKVVFSPSEKRGEISPSHMVLTNGDVIPGTIRSLASSALSVESADAGVLEISRDAVAALQFGIGENRMIQSGIGTIQDWAGDEILDAWKLEEQTLIMSGQGLISKKLELPSCFIIRFRITWDKSAAFQLTFADPLAEEDESSDHYAFRLSSAGIELRRHTSDGTPPVTIGFLKRSLKQYPDKSMLVELRVDRPHRLLSLYLDGEPEGRFLDIMRTAPLAGGISIQNMSMDESELQFRQFEVAEWNPANDRYRTETRGDAHTDALITRHGERWNGRLLAIQSRAMRSVYVFQSDSLPQPIELPEEEISTVFFAGNEHSHQNQTNPFSLRFQGNGMLSVASCAFDEMNAQVVHPLLGTLIIPRQRIASLRWSGKEGGKP